MIVAQGKSEKLKATATRLLAKIIGELDEKEAARGTMEIVLKAWRHKEVLFRSFERS